MRLGRSVALCLLLALALAAQDPREGTVPLSAADGWRAALLLDREVGVWTVKSYPLLEEYGMPEVIALDDRGRCTVLVGYSGRWTPLETVEDRQWLGAIARADLVAGDAGPELYVGGQSGRVLRIWPRPSHGFDVRQVAHFPGDEVHTMVGGDLDAAHEGDELLIFLKSGRVALLHPESPETVVDLGKVTGRVRDALVLPTREGASPLLLAASRAGVILELRLEDRQLSERVIHRAPMGFGRLAAKRDASGHASVLYATRDDGVILRLRRRGVDYPAEIIYAGPEGPRGLAAGNFVAEPGTESVAVHGYSGRVQLISRKDSGPWTVTTLFEAEDKGHWLEVAELDGRNSTDELLVSGYDGRVVLLARSPGYGLPGVATEPEAASPKATEHTEPSPKGNSAAEEGATSTEATATKKVRPYRLGVSAGAAAADGPSPLSYGGGFVPKSLVYETLFVRDDAGHIAPGLASGYELTEDRCGVIVTIDPTKRWHDGTPVRAEEVATWMQGWLASNVHSWLPLWHDLKKVEALDAQRLLLAADRPVAILPQLTAINPCSVRKPGTDPEVFLGTGPYKWGGVADDGSLIYEPTREGLAPLALVPYDRDATPAVHALRNRELDGLLASYHLPVSNLRLQDIRRHKLASEERHDGTVTWRLELSGAGALSAREARLRLLSCVPTPDQLAAVFPGPARPAYRFVQGMPALWGPSLGALNEAATRVPFESPLRFLVRSEDPREMELAQAIYKNLNAGGVPAKLTALPEPERDLRIAAGHADLWIERTWGGAYDPFLSLVAHYLPEAEDRAGRNRWADAWLPVLEAVRAVANEPDPTKLPPLYTEVQEQMDRMAVVMPLVVEDGVLLTRRPLEGLQLGHDPYRLRVR